MQRGIKHTSGAERVHGGPTRGQKIQAYNYNKVLQMLIGICMGSVKTQKRDGRKLRRRKGGVGC